MNVWSGMVRRAIGPARKAVRPPPLPPRRRPGTCHADPVHRAVLKAASALPDGTPVDGVLRAAVLAEVAARRAGAAMDGGPASPMPDDLEVRTRDLPDWWAETGSLLLQSPGNRTVEFSLGLVPRRIRNALVVVGAHGAPPRFSLVGDDAMIMFGDRITMISSAITVGEGATVLVGTRTTGTFMNFADVRNGGMLVIGEDCMLASGIAIHTDDIHAIRDAATDRRLNVYGGRVLIEDHVWLADQVRIMGDARIGTNAVIGASSFVKNVYVRPGTVCAGRPLRTIREGIVWSREDLP